MRLERVKIGEIAKVKGGKRLPHGYDVQDEPTDHPYLRVVDFDDNGLNPAHVKFISNEAHEKIRRYTITDKDIYVSIAGTIGRVGIVPALFSGANLTENAAKITDIGESVDAPYLYYFLKGHTGQELLKSKAGGTSQPKLALYRLAEIEFPKPSFQAQRRTADILAAYDDLIENNRRRIALLEAAARLLYREWFVQFRFPGHEHVEIIDGLPVGWERRELGGIVEVVKDTVKPSDFVADDIHIGLQHISRRSFTLADWESAKDLASGKTRFEEGDILFCKIRPYFHKVGFTLRAGLASSDALVWRAKDTEDWPLVVCATSSDHFVAVASKTVREGSKMPRADWNVLQKYSIPKPPVGLLRIFNDTVNPITAQCKALALQNRVLAQARDLLLPRLMNGEISV